MEIREIKENKKDFMDLLFLADEQEEMIDKYLDKGRMFVLFENGEALGEAVVVDLGETKDGHTFELKNLATQEKVHGQGYGKRLVQYVLDRYKDQGDFLIVGTGDSPLTVPFYKKCGFTDHHRLKNFFTDNYDHPIFEEGIQLIDMVYFGQPLHD